MLYIGAGPLKAGLVHGVKMVLSSSVSVCWTLLVLVLFIWSVVSLVLWVPIWLAHAEGVSPMMVELIQCLVTLLLLLFSVHSFFGLVGMVSTLVLNWL